MVYLHLLEGGQDLREDGITASDASSGCHADFVNVMF